MRKSHWIYCFLLTVFLLSVTGCRPKGILSSKQMEDIFVDLHTAEAILQEAGYNYGHDEALRAYYLVILKQYGVTQAQFDSSLVWYTANPTIFDKIYPRVIDRLQTQYDTYAARMETAKQESNKTVDEWLKLCQKGYDKGPWEKKCKKSAQKFVYVRKLL